MAVVLSICVNNYLVCLVSSHSNSLNDFISVNNANPCEDPDVPISVWDANTDDSVRAQDLLRHNGDCAGCYTGRICI